MTAIQTKLNAGLLLSLICTFFILWLTVSQGTREIAESYVASRLQHDSEALLNAIRFESDKRFTVTRNQMDAIYHMPFSGHYYQLQIGEQTIHSRSLWDQQLAINAYQNMDNSLIHITGPEQQPLIALVKTYQKSNQLISVIVAEDLSALEQNIDQFQNTFSLIGITLLLFLISANIAMVKLGLQPLKKVRSQIHDLEKGSRNNLDENISKEIQPLVSQINRLLSILDKRLSRSRNALSDLAHALKKPLTILRQLQMDERLQPHKEIQTAIAHQVEQMRRTIDRVLRRARMAGQGPTELTFDTSQDVEPLIQVLKKIHHRKNIQVEISISKPIRISMDREDCLEILGNLTDNAFKWANHRVFLSMEQQEQLVLIVEDDGPGVPDSFYSTLSQRGNRLDESTEGHGLGLAIAQEIVTNYHGTMCFGRSQSLGGFRVLVTLPVPVREHH